jgi:hypothetical protein
MKSEDRCVESAGGDDHTLLLAFVLNEVHSAAAVTQLGCAPAIESR